MVLSFLISLLKHEKFISGTFRFSGSNSGEKVKVMLNQSNKYIQTLIWIVPAINVLFVIGSLVFREKYHSYLYARVFLLGIGFSVISSYYYKRHKSFGISIFFGLFAIMLFGLLPNVFKYIYWLIVVFVSFYELKNLNKNSVFSNFNVFLVSVFLLFIVVVPFFFMECSQPNSYVKLLKSHIHVDTLYHIALASMMKINNTVSLGLHGVIPHEYHFGSHLLMMSASSLTGFSVFESYSHFYSSFCLPLLGVSAIAVAEEYYPSKNRSDFLIKLFSYVFIMLSTGVMIGDSFVAKFALGPTFYESESYAVSLIFFFCFFSVLRKRAFQREKEYLRGFFILGILVFVILTKVSTGFCALVLLGCWSLFSEESTFTKTWYFRWIVFFISSLLFILLFQFINPTMSDSAWMPYQFVSAYTVHFEPFWFRYFSFIFIFFIFVITALVLYIMNYNICRFHFPLWWCLGTSLTLFVGIIVLTFFYIEGGSGYTFGNMSQFMAMPFLLCVFIFLKKKFSSVTLKLLIFLFFLFSFFYTPKIIMNGVTSFVSDISQKTPTTELSVYIEKLEKIRNDPHSLKAVIHIPRKELDFWNSSFPICRKVGLIIPAVSERPALYGWPSNECYGFLCGPRFHSNGLCEKSKGVFTDEELLTETKRLGFNRVYVVTSKETRILQ